MKVDLFQVHGTLQVLAFAVLFPIGILVALFRNYIGVHWFVLHVCIQLAASATAILALVVVMVAVHQRDSNKDKDKTKHVVVKSTKTSLHVIVGYSVFALIVFQVIWAMALRNVIPRYIWYIVHMAIAVGIIVGGWTNLYLGTQL
jgi:hypothetical protein